MSKEKKKKQDEKESKEITNHITAKTYVDMWDRTIENVANENLIFGGPPKTESGKSMGVPDDMKGIFSEASQNNQ